MTTHPPTSTRTRCVRALGMFLAAFVLVPVWAEEIRGRVETDNGGPVDHARVVDTAAGRHVFTDVNGVFTIDCDLPCVLVVTHPWLDDQEIRVENSEDLRVELEGGHAEQIVVTASRGVGDTYAPISLPSTLVHTDDRIDAPATLLELVRQAPSVAENGQGGLFQVLSIRGVSRQRVATLVSGIPVVGERRAGVSASFIDPLLIEGAEVLRGPSSTYYGSGALGGVVQMFPRRSDGLSIQTGYDSFGDQNHVAANWGNGTWSVGLAQRSSNDDETADGTPTHTQFTQYSTMISRHWRRGKLQYEVLAIGSFGEDIGKANSDFPDKRVTTYPEERHLMVKFGVISDRKWRVHVFTHPNDLRTDTLRIGDFHSVIENEATDAGAAFRRDFELSSNVKGRFGLDYFGRYGVVAREDGQDLMTGALSSDTTLDGEQHDAAAYGSLDWNWGSGTLQGGARFVWHEQHSAGTTARSENGWTGFLGLTKPLAAGLELVANLGTGLRYPSLSERFFTGSTGRGQVIGNPDLNQEDSLDTDLGLRYSGHEVLVNTHLFRLEIDDYIERIDVTDDLQTFVNLTSGTIEGVEIDGLWHPSGHWQLSWGAARIEGQEDGSGRPLPDIPSRRGRVGVRYLGKGWSGMLEYEHRASKKDRASGEMAIPTVDLVSAGLEWELSDELRLRLQGKNLLDESYFNSADDKSPVAPGRSFGVGLIWKR